ncbi:MAG TPA: carboxypeptidase-like regulatory domain-containing protein [Terracidiphilus sp.]|nr:carboxypeptidase-like regulatory domain-containing protein [Terracidiphilus sp.]
MTERTKYTLEVPLDASGIKDFKPNRGLKVAAYSRDGAVAGSTVAVLNEKGQGSAKLGFNQKPGGLRVAIGPENASDEDLSHLQTISVNVAPTQWKENRAALTPIAISPYYWWWWQEWCRDYTITGRLVCADGSPVPGATVCAYDVDWWWWWISEYQVGCAVTDANGAFQIKFRRCCGWWWWWWWERRRWIVDPYLADHILPILQQIPGIRRPPLPDPAPDLSIFESILSQTGSAVRTLANAAPQLRSRSSSGAFDPNKLESLRSELLARLPKVAELEALCVWPWCPWWPWWDCDADILFRATQNCNGAVKVIVDEGILQTRFDIPTNLNVTLVANDQACCLAQPCQVLDACPPGDCMLPIDICDTTSASVGGNPGANAALATIGYENPGGAAPGSPAGDRPFSESVLLATNFGDAFSGDYYEFEWATSKAGPYSAMPLAADGAFNRYFWDAMLNQHHVLFAPTPINSPLGMRNVFESRQHYEANNSIGIGWDMCAGCNYPTLMWWQTNNTGFANGTYYLRLRSWVRPGNAGDLAYPADYPTGIVPFCGDNPEDNYVVITIDNRPTPGPAAGHPLDHPCGPGTVHVCTRQPDCNIFSVTIAGQQVSPCANITAKDSDPVEIDFMVHDDDGMLGYYSLACNYGLNLTEDLIDLSGVHIGSVDRGPGATVHTSWFGPADAVGPDYGSAILVNPPNTLQGATAPYWYGGTLKLTTTVGALFPVTCCYQLQLWVYKRNIVNCYYGIDSNGYYNLTEMSFTVFKS